MVTLKHAASQKSLFVHTSWIMLVCRIAQGGGHHVAPQPGAAGVWLDLWTGQLTGQQSQIAGRICILLSILQ